MELTVIQTINKVLRRLEPMLQKRSADFRYEVHPLSDGSTELHLIGNRGLALFCLRPDKRMLYGWNQAHGCYDFETPGPMGVDGIASMVGASLLLADRPGEEILLDLEPFGY